MAATGKSGQEAGSDISRKSRRNIALTMIGIGAGGIVLISVTMIVAAAFGDKMTINVASLIFPALLGVFGTWVGTVLTFYFGQDNFQAASEESRLLARDLAPAPENSANRRLDEIMLSGSEILRVEGAKGDLDKKTIAEVHSLLSEGDSRLFLLNEKKQFVYLVYKSVLDNYIGNVTEEQKNAGQTYDRANDSIGQMAAFDESRFGNRMGQEIVVFAGVGTTVGEAKASLRRKPTAWDIVITEDGTPATKMIGWVPNTLLTGL